MQLGETNLLQTATQAYKKKLPLTPIYFLGI